MHASLFAPTAHTNIAFYICFYYENRNEKDQSIKQNLISEQKAIEIAEKAVNGTVEEVELDEDDNHYVYELKLNTSKGEVEVEIDAITGKVLEKEYDDDDDDLDD